MPHTPPALIGTAEAVECILIGNCHTGERLLRKTRTLPGPPSRRRDCETSGLDIWSRVVWRVAGHCLNVILVLSWQISNSLWASN